MSEQSTSALHQAVTWTAAAAGYAESVEPLTRPFAGPTLDRLGPASGDDDTRLPDVAAGTGILALEAARRGAAVVATDFAPGMLDQLRRRATDERLVETAAFVHVEVRQVRRHQAIADPESFPAGSRLGARAAPAARRHDS